MILLKKIRLINWYGFAHVTAPIGFFTLIAGKNGNGKSVMLDAIKYAAYGDTVFNKSSESKGSRTLSSYTRGLLDATAGTYMRPADKVPNVYSHIVLEYYDGAEERSFLLGTVIETNAANNYQVYRYVMDKKTLDEVGHTYEEQGRTLPYTASALQKRYQLILLNKEQGIPRFMQMTGLKLNMKQMPTYLRKLRGIMSYDPDAKIDRFIRESVLEEKNVDFAKLIEAKGNIERLNQTFQMIEGEIEELDGILSGYDTYENEKNRLLADDIKTVYKGVRDLEAGIERDGREKELAEQKKEEAALALDVLSGRMKELEERLIQARVSLNQLDSARMIAAEERHLSELHVREKELFQKRDSLELFQTKISEIIHMFAEKNKPIKKKEILSSLCGREYSSVEKERAVNELKRQMDEFYDEYVERLGRIKAELGELDQKLGVQAELLEACRKHRNAYQQIPEYVGLRDEINREFEKRKIAEKAMFACEYVIGLEKEEWRDAIETFLGPRRYTIHVEPKYYDIADDVLNRSRYRYAHLFNTKLLMKKEIKVEEDSAVHMLEIRNFVAQKYFDFQLGRMHAVDIGKVRDYENAISKEGRVSVAMDSYFLRFEKLRFYYLGQKTFELNRIRAEKEIKRLQGEKTELLAQQTELEFGKNRLNGDKGFFREYDYDAAEEYQKTVDMRKSSEKQLKQLKQAQKNNREFMELSQMVEKLSVEKEAVRREQEGKITQESELRTRIGVYESRIADKSEELQKQKKQWKEYEIEFYPIVKRAVEAYDKFVENGQQGAGGLLSPETRGRLSRSIEQHKKELIGFQSAYNSRHPEGSLPVDTSGRQEYAARRDRIWMDSLQEIRQKLEEQTRRYEDIFKNEFVLTILNACEKAREDLKQINGELAKLHFSEKYEFDIHYVKDGSEYARILEYARYLDEREQLGSSDGQMTFSMLTKVSDEEGEALEQELKRIINRIIEKNSEEAIARFADYRNYMTYEILISNQNLSRAKLSRQIGFNSGAEVQIPYLLILCAALLLIYNQRVNSTRLAFIDEPFAKMDPGNVRVMLDFMKRQKMQVIFCSPDKTESIGNECEVILPVLRVRADSMQMGVIQFHEEKAYDGL